MALTLYLAMTGAEMYHSSCMPEHAAWMACHFSPYSSGISNIPQQLPAESVLILNDRIPPQGHDPALVASQLAETAMRLSADRVLLDFQRPDCTQTAAIAEAVVATLPCPVGVTPVYAQKLACPVFLSPLLHKPLHEQLTIWAGRDIWLEAALECVQVDVTEQGSRFYPAPLPDSPPVCHTDEALHCRYFIELDEHCARFTLWRDHDLLRSVLKEAENLGVTCAIGLYQQLQEKAAED